MQLISQKGALSRIETADGNSSWRGHWAGPQKDGDQKLCEEECSTFSSSGAELGVPEGILCFITFKGNSLVYYFLFYSFFILQLKFIGFTVTLALLEASLRAY